MWPALIGVGSQIAGSMFGGGRKRDAGAFQLPGDWNRRITGAGQRGQQAEEEYFRRMQSFDPMAAATAANQAQYAIAMPQIQRAVAGLRGAQAGSRLNTGYGHADQDRVLTDNLNNLNQSMVARAMEAANMQMANNQALGGYGLANTNLYLDATLGRHQTEQDRRAAEAASRRGMWGNLMGAAIGAAGSYLGRPR